ncbi:hypothetical protein [Streptomyces calidiresistens]|uniref:Uncharacterized protein n=1 Tax=Streptomyces calidiresistens TaxID=1485586 RepID=A0A7W3T237_9ACTN|nr:hypothetical protein [Streptomyces calidiresistens]MBB0229488.1 hypothetical protein [Streptomyces calidiresistens]
MNAPGGADPISPAVIAVAMTAVSVVAVAEGQPVWGAAGLLAASGTALVAVNEYRNLRNDKEHNR